MVTGHDYLKEHLHKIGVADSPLCSLCNAAEDIYSLLLMLSYNNSKMSSEKSLQKWKIWMRPTTAVKRYVKTLAEVVSCCYCCWKIAVPGRDKAIAGSFPPLLPSPPPPITQPESGDNKGQFYWLLAGGSAGALSRGEDNSTICWNRLFSSGLVPQLQYKIESCST
ncbi:unnamed protein product [Nezara viridula]|uniref:Uncharacterized protein n=1 Tax=Nezara viridula TaxID=85310 RepID=A0A9P0H2U6_NEZVI|nr:unnamed protein product [Nezara viridula]